MEYRRLGKSELMVSEIGCGCWPIGGGWGDTDDEADIASLEHAYDHGVNFFDTAMLYGAGRSEELLGQTFGGMRDKVIIATKVSQNHMQPADLFPGTRHCGIGLRRCRCCHHRIRCHPFRSTWCTYQFSGHTVQCAGKR